MNRTTVICLALAILFAHTLAIHQTVDGELAPPYEVAHVAFRLARNLVHHGAATWNPGHELAESYPSPLWIGLATAGERLRSAPNLVTQWVGILSTLATVVVLAQFSANRIAGLIAPALLASSGAAAAAAASGTEAPLAMLAITTAFLAYERRWAAALAAALGTLVLTRPEGLAICVAIAIVRLFTRRREEPATRAALNRAFLVPAALAVSVVGARRVLFGTWLSPFESQVLRWDPDQWRLGLHYVRSYVLCSGSGWLMVFPLAFLLVGRAQVVGRRALFLAVFWIAAVVAAGGSALPFWNALAPILPMVFLAVQETMTAWMDHRPSVAPFVWSVLIASFCTSLLVSKSPSDVGPLPLERIQRAWLTDETLEHAYGRGLGRSGLAAEIREVERLRALGVFLREKVSAPTAIITTFWPGAIGYLSRKTVYDALGRTSAAPGEERCQSWSGVPRVDLVSALERRTDYVVPIIGSLGEGAQPEVILSLWLERYDRSGDTPERREALLRALSRFELVSVPVPDKSYQPRVAATVPFLLLRSRSLGLTPRTTIELERGGYRVMIEHRGHEQIVDLTVSIRDREGAVWNVRPTGELVQEPSVSARANLLLYPTTSRPIDLLRGHFPEWLDPVEVRAQLHNPGSKIGGALAAIGAPVTATVE